MSGKIYLGPNAADLDYDDKVPKITRVNLGVDSDHMYTSGDDTGRTLEVNCPWGTQEMADSILLKVSGIDYQPYEANDALLDPSAEIGDGITLGGVYSVLAQLSISLDKQCAANISAPYNDEIDDEYPYKSPDQRKVERKIAQTRSMITKTAKEIMLEVSSELDSLSSSIKVKLDGITLETIGADGKVSSVKLFDTGKIDLTGYATFTGLSGGTTTINGGCIKTGYIRSNRIGLLKDMLWYPSDVPGGQTEESWFVDDNAVGQIGFTRLTVDNASTDALTYSATKNPLVLGSNLTTYVVGNEVKIEGTFYVNGVQPTIISDRRLKHDIDYSLSGKMADLFDGLMPVSYRLNSEPERKRLGFIAQDVLFAGNQCGLPDVAVDIDNNGHYVLQSDELLASVVAKVKQLEKRLEVLEQ